MNRASKSPLLRHLPMNMAIHTAEEREKRYVANHETAGKTPVSTRANTDANAHPK